MIIEQTGNGFHIDGKVAASNTILPGQVLTRAANGEFALAAQQTTKQQPLVCLPDEASNKSVNDSYTAAQSARASFVGSGQVVKLRVEAGAAAIALNSFLQVGATAGYVSPTTTPNDSAIAIAMESLDNSGSASDAFVSAFIL